MADNDLKIQVTTTADTGGIDQVINATKKLTDEQKNFQSVANRTGETWSQVQARFAQGPQLIQGITQEARKTAVAFELTRTEAAALANELIRGNLNARSLGVALGGVSTPLAILTIGLFTIVELIKKASDEQDKWVTEVLKTTAEMDKLGESILRAQDALRQTALIGALPLEAGLRLARQELERLKTEQSLVNLETKEGLEEYKRYTGEIARAQGVVDRLVTSQQHQTDVVQQTTDQIALNRASGNEELTIQLKVQKIYDDKLRVLREAHVPEALARDLASETAESERQKLEAIRGQAAPQNDLNALLERAATILQSIRQRQQLIAGEPFLSADEKNLALLRSSVTEMEQLVRLQKELEARKAGPLDPAELARVNRELQTTQFRMQQIRQEQARLTQPLRTELSSWAAGFGSTSQQIGKTIEGTIGAALQSVNQFLVTGKFNAQALLQQIILLGLQLVEQILIQQAMAAINNALAAAQARIAGTAIATAMAPAATAATIATEGAAAAQAPFSIAAALAASMGILVGAHEGGPISRRRKRFHDGGLASDEVPVIAQEGEVMIQRSVAQRPGMLEYLLALNAGQFHDGGAIPRMHDGGDWRKSWEGEGDIDITFPGGRIPTLGPRWAEAGLDPQINRAMQTWPGAFSPGPFTPGGIFITPFGNITTIGSSGYPRAIPVSSGPDYYAISKGGPAHRVSAHLGRLMTRVHTGGITNHYGGNITNRYHPGGAISTGTGGGKTGGMGGVHIYAFTDLRQLTRHMASQDGQKIIFDTVKGRRIDLGIK